MEMPKVTFEQIARPLVAILFLVMFSGAVATQAAGDAPTTFYHYELPQSVQDARQACYEQAAEDRDIPQGDQYIVWWNANKGTSAQHEWTVAFEACKDANPMPGGKWNWDGMTLVGIEELP